MELDAPFAPAMLYVNNLDKPGFIGARGQLLGEAGVNIATFNLGRVAAGGTPSRWSGSTVTYRRDVLAKIQALPQVKEAKQLKF